MQMIRICIFKATHAQNGQIARGADRIPRSFLGQGV